MDGVGTREVVEVANTKNSLTLLDSLRSCSTNYLVFIQSETGSHTTEKWSQVTILVITESTLHYNLTTELRILRSGDKE